MTEQSTNSAKVQLGQLYLMGLFTGIWVRGYLQEQKGLKDSCITKAYSSVGNNV